MSNVTNLSLGASSGTSLALFRLIEGLNLEHFDIVFLDSIVNEQWQVSAGKSPNYLWKMARLLYAALPSGVIYCFLGFATRPRFYQSDAVEHIHQSLCYEFGINFVPLRQVLVEFAATNMLTPKQIFGKSDLSHFSRPLSKNLMHAVLNFLPNLPQKRSAAIVDQENFFIDDVRGQASYIETYATSLREQSYGVFGVNSIVHLKPGSFLGFDYTELGSEAFLCIKAHREFQKALYFPSTKPWMKITSFDDEVLTDTASSIVLRADYTDGLPIETTDAIRPINRPMTGTAKIASLFFAKQPLSAILSVTGADRASSLKNPILIGDFLSKHLKTHKEEALKLLEDDEMS